MPNEHEKYREDDDANALRAHIFQRDDRQELIVPVPEWERDILIKELTGTKRSEYIAFQIALDENQKNTPEYWKRLWFQLAYLGCVHPRTKEPIFKVADRDTCMDTKNGAIIEMLGRTVQSFSKLDGTVGDRVRKNLLGILSTSTTMPLPNASEATTGE